MPTRVSADHPDFDALFRSHYERVVRWTRALGIDPAEAHDVTQEVFIVAHRKRAEIPALHNARGWLFSIARGLVANARRGAKREQARRQLAAGPEAVPTPHQVVERSEAARVMQSFLDELPDDQRDVFILYELEGMKAPEVARVLEVAPELVHVRVRLARERLRRVIELHCNASIGEGRR